MKSELYFILFLEATEAGLELPGGLTSRSLSRADYPLNFKEVSVEGHELPCCVL